MFTTAQYRAFGARPEDRELAKPRQLLREGNAAAALAAYRELVTRRPEHLQAWREYFDLLRARGRHADALALADEARRSLGPVPAVAALRGAALVELGRTREGLRELQAAADADPDLALTWHEMGAAAWRLGESAFALFALDRAFALEPSSRTLYLRGEVLQSAGQFAAAEVAFTAAAEAAEFPTQQDDALRQIAVTRRHAAFPCVPARLGPAQRWFARTGSVILAGAGGRAGDTELVLDLVRLIRAAGWAFTSVVTADHWSGWQALAAELRLPLTRKLQPGFEIAPLLVGVHPVKRWVAWHENLATAALGLSFLLEQPADGPAAGMAGRLEGHPGTSDPAENLRLARHPDAVPARHRLGPMACTM